ncbi:MULTISPECIES: class I SAM-dependent methyltransferase [Catenuloplanes]|uniref:Methyltransferase domain-containing protein n=1 Tax=Catenuloplanes niger TaxID=587534 RepID=A0AAE4CYE2_9ACTN|nr:class I SAM-dependent methyltransferase [Catenuloplanes niger]MDR7327478.1 hypothetical protein [Catenuloplanes niger]
MSDEYRDSAEFLDLMSHGMWDALRGPVTAALHGADPANGPVVDLGAGTGLGTATIAAALPKALITAVEPSSSLRAALLARIGVDPDLRARVSVLGDPAETVALPGRAAAVLALNMIGHLAPDARRDLWRRVAGTLPPSAPLVVNVQPPDEAVPVEETVFARVPVGGHVYEGGGRAEPSGPGQLTWHMTYRVRDAAGTVVREAAVSYAWHVLSVPALVTELAAVGLEAQPVEGGLVRAVTAPTG